MNFSARFLKEHDMLIVKRGDSFVIFGKANDFIDFMYITFEMQPVKSFLYGNGVMTLFSYHNTDDCVLTQCFGKGYRFICADSDTLKDLADIMADFEVA